MADTSGMRIFGERVCHFGYRYGGTRLGIDRHKRIGVRILFRNGIRIRLCKRRPEPVRHRGNRPHLSRTVERRQRHIERFSNLGHDRRHFVG